MTTQAITLSPIVTDADWVGTFTHIEVARSVLGAEGPWQEMTALSWSPARLPLGAPDAPVTPVTGPTVTIAGTTLELLLGEETALSIAITGAAPLTTAEVAAQVQSKSGGQLTAWAGANGQLTMQTTWAGSGAALRVTGGAAAGILGLETEEPFNVAYGKEAHLRLLAGVTRYGYTDLLGSTDYFYRTRFWGEHARSDWSQPIGQAAASGVAADSLIEGHLRLLTLGGQPLVGARVCVFNRYALGLVAGSLVAGPPIEGLTDTAGRVSFTLVRGTKVSFAVDSTNIVRSITVPTDPSLSSFDLLDPALGADDAFRVRVPILPSASRRSP